MDTSSAGEREKLILIGSGGHAKIVIDALQTSRYEIVGMIERDDSLLGKVVCEIPVIGTDGDLPELLAQGIRYAILGIGQMGDPGPRNQIVQRLSGLGFTLAVAIHPTAVISKFARIGAGTVVCAGAVINAGAQVGENCIINTGAVIEHDVILGKNVHAALNSAVSGGTVVGDGAWIGMGSNVIQGIHLGAGCIVGAGSTVIRDVEPGSTVVGTPAKKLNRSK